MEHYTKKVILLGDGAVGKTSLIRQFVFDKFGDEYITTVGTKVTKKEMRLSGTEVTLTIWDVLGQQDFSRVQHRAFQGAHGMMLVLDLTRPETYQSWLQYWIPECMKITGAIPLIALGNKADLVNGRKVSGDMMAAFGERFACNVYDTSAKTGIHVEEAFTRMCELLVDGEPKNDLAKRDKAFKEVVATRVHRDRNVFADVTDEIIHDFCSRYPSMDHGMPIVRKQFEAVGLDIKAPTEAGLIKAIWKLAEVEATMLPPDEVTKNRFKRMKMVKRIKLSQQ